MFGRFSNIFVYFIRYLFRLQPLYRYRIFSVEERSKYVELEQEPRRKRGNKNRGNNNWTPLTLNVNVRRDYFILTNPNGYGRIDTPLPSFSFTFSFTGEDKDEIKKH